MRRNAFAWSGIVLTILIALVFQFTKNAQGIAGEATANNQEVVAPRPFTPYQGKTSNPLLNSTYNARTASEHKLVAAEEAQSSRRRSFTPPATEEKVPEKVEPKTAAPSGVQLPTSLDDALSRLKDYPLKSTLKKEEPKPAANPTPTKSATPAASPKADSTPPSRFSAPTTAAKSIEPKPAVVEQPKPVQAPVGNSPAPQANAPISLSPKTATAPKVNKPTTAPSRFQGLPQTTKAPVNTGVRTPVATPQPSVAAVPSRPSVSLSPENLFAVQSPSVAVSTLGPKSIVIGKEAIFRVNAKNLGVTDAQNLNVRIRLPHGIQLLGQQASLGTPKMVAAGNYQGVLNWEIPMLPARSEGTIQLRVVPQTGQKFDLAVDVVYSASSSSRSISILEPKLAMKIEGANDVLYGESKLYKIVMYNPGTGTAENVGLTLMPLKQGQQPTTFDKIGNIPPGEQKVIEVELTAKQAGQLLIQAKSFADGNLNAEVSQQVLVRRANLQLIAQGPPVKYAATEATYKLNVHNSGNAPANEVIAEAKLPAGAQFVSASSGGAYDKESNSVVWEVGKLDANANRPLELNCILMVGGNNSISAQCASVDGLLATKSLTTLVESLADLKLHVNDPKGPVPVGEEVEYEFRLENRGTKAAEGINISVNFTEGIQPISAKGAESQIQGGQVSFVSLGKLDAGKEIVLKVAAKASTAGSHSFRAEVRCTEPVTKLASEETTRFYATGTAGSTIPSAVPSQAMRNDEPSPLLPLPYRGLR